MADRIWTAYQQFMSTAALLEAVPCTGSGQAKTAGPENVKSTALSLQTVMSLLAGDVARQCHMRGANSSCLSSQHAIAESMESVGSAFQDFQSQVMEGASDPYIAMKVHLEKTLEPAVVLQPA